MNEICENCKAEKGLHHYQTLQCPLGGYETPIGKEQKWEMTTFKNRESKPSELAGLREIVKGLTERIETLEAQVKKQAEWQKRWR